MGEWMVRELSKHILEWQWIIAKFPLPRGCHGNGRAFVLPSGPHTGVWNSKSLALGSREEANLHHQGVFFPSHSLQPLV